ncbi:MAG: biopolymer transporter ExbD [Fuerstiella sp.]|nr:biopolymer transporter ExbD [Fuerstiella sp.]MCP4856670.1 biopolymer transporter ExbD [Fuerstiella sp.]
MPLRTESLEEPQLNLTPMIDIVFLLIIFFMVGTRFSEIEHKFDIELPTASIVEPMTSRPDSIVLNVARSGEVTIDGENLTLLELQSRLESARESYSEQSVLIRGDGEGMYQSIVDVMDVCHKAQIHRFSLAFQPFASGDSP